MNFMKNEQNNFAFIDSQNLNLAIKGCGWNLDFQKFFIHLKHKYRINKAFIFIGYVAGNEKLYKIGIPNKGNFSALLRKFSKYHFYINKLKHKVEYLDKKKFR